MAIKKVCLGVCLMVFMRIVTFKNYFECEKVLWAILGNMGGCINFVGVLF